MKPQARYLYDFDTETVDKLIKEEEQRTGLELPVTAETLGCMTAYDEAINTRRVQNADRLFATNNVNNDFKGSTLLKIIKYLPYKGFRTRPFCKMVQEIYEDIQISKFFPEGINHVQVDTKTFTGLQYVSKESFLNEVKLTINANTDSACVIVDRFEDGNDNMVQFAYNADPSKFTIYTFPVTTKGLGAILDDIKKDISILNFDKNYILIDSVARYRNEYGHAWIGREEALQEKIKQMEESKDCGVYEHHNVSKIFACNMRKRYMIVFTYKYGTKDDAVARDEKNTITYDVSTGIENSMKMFAFKATAYTALVQFFIKFGKLNNDKRFKVDTEEERKKFESSYKSALDYFELLKMIPDHLERYLGYEEVRNHCLGGIPIYDIEKKTELGNYFNNMIKSYKSLSDIFKYVNIWKDKLVIGKDTAAALEREIQTADANITDFMNRAAALQAQREELLKKFNAIIYGMEDDGADKARDICNFLENTKTIYNYEVSNEKIWLEFISPMHFGNYDEFKKNWNKEKNAYKLCSTGQQKILDAMMIFMKDDSPLKFLGYSCFRFEVGGLNLPESHAYLTRGYFKPAPGNPHFCVYTCYGSFDNILRRCLRDKDYLMFLNLLSEASGGLNSYESQNVKNYVNEVVKNVYSPNATAESKKVIMDMKTKERITIEEAYARYAKEHPEEEDKQ